LYRCLSVYYILVVVGLVNVVCSFDRQISKEQKFAETLNTTSNSFKIQTLTAQQKRFNKLSARFGTTLTRFYVHMGVISNSIVQPSTLLRLVLLYLQQDDDDAMNNSTTSVQVGF
jgi:hypothetical protein